MHVFVFVSCVCVCVSCVCLLNVYLPKLHMLRLEAKPVHITVLRKCGPIRVVVVRDTCLQVDRNARVNWGTEHFCNKHCAGRMFKLASF